MTSRAMDVLLRLLAALTAAALLLMLSHRPAHAACAYYGMNPNTTYSITDNPEIIRFHPSRASWMVMATRPNVSGEDWDLGLYLNTAADPECVAGLIASSSASGPAVDFVLGDYTHNVMTDVYARFQRYSGTSWTLAQWRDTAVTVLPQGAFVYRSWTSTDLADVWNVPLVAGLTYTLSFTHGAGIDAKLLVLDNPFGASYWAGRGSALLTTSSTTNYTAPRTGNYAFVVVNDNAGSGDFAFGVGRCTTPTALTSGTSAWTDDAYHDWSYTASSSFWGAVGVLATDADYDLATYSGTGGAGYPDCLSGILAGSSATGRVDFVVSDFNHTPWGTYDVRSLRWSGEPGARMLWQMGSGVLLVNDTPVIPTFSAATFLRTWDVLLTAGTTYHFVFEPTSPNLHLLLFRNAGGGTYHAGRGAAEFDVTFCMSYTAPASGYYGIVVADDDGGVASCRLGVNAAPCICPKPILDATPAVATAANDYFSMTPVWSYWAVAAMHGTAGSDDWDVTVGGYATGSAAPLCIGNVLAASSQSGSVVDFVAIDYNTTPMNPLHLRALRFSGASATGLVQWLSTGEGLFANGTPVVATQGSTDLADVYDGWMTATWPYRIYFHPSSAGQKLLVFENATGGTCMLNRSSAALVVTSGTVTYTPTVSGYHAFVVLNDDGVECSYEIGYGICRNPTVLSSGTVVVPAFGFSDFQFSEAVAAWTAVGVRPTASDWDVSAGTGMTGPFPDCIGPIVATSAYSSNSMVDLVVGDFHHNGTGTCYAEAIQYTPGTMFGATVEWDSGLNSILGNDNNAIERTTGPGDVLECWDLYMSAGITYTFYLSQSGSADLHLLVFRNPSGGTYWAGRNAAVLDLPVASGSASYTAPASDDYAVVVLNDNGETSTYSLMVKYCLTPTALTSGVPLYTIPETFKSFTQSAAYWTAVGVRGSSDWEIGVYQNPSGDEPGVCLSSPLAFSTQVGVADLIVGDFNAGANIPGTFYVRPWRALGTSTGTLEWDDGANALPVGGALTHRTTGSADVLECWDVGLTAGNTYGIFFPHTGTADLKVLLFRNPGSTYWAPRSARVLESATHATYTAPATDWYGLVVVNDNGADGVYDLGVYLGGVGVELQAPPAVTALRGVSPNPARNAFTLEYALHEAADVRVELLDLAGRRIGALEEGRRDAGVWRAIWPGDRRTSPGVYVVRLVVDGRTIGQRKVAVLR
jgi:hypothetical protein